MKSSEFSHILAAIIVATIVFGFSSAVGSQWEKVAQVFLFSVIIVLVTTFSKKALANALDVDIEHRIWTASRYGYKPHQHLEKGVPAGIIFPLFFSVFSLGFVKFAAFLTFEAKAMKRRAAKRFGPYSVADLTDKHIAWIGAAGIISALLISIIIYFLPTNLEYLSKFAAYFALSNLIPISKLDGAQIFFGNRILWTALALITLVFTVYAIIPIFSLI